MNELIAIAGRLATAVEAGVHALERIASAAENTRQLVASGIDTWQQQQERGKRAQV